MSSNSVCNHTRDQQIRLPLRARQVLLITCMITDRIGLQALLVHHLGLVLLSYIPVSLEQKAAPDHPWSMNVVKTAGTVPSLENQSVVKAKNMS